MNKLILFLAAVFLIANVFAGVSETVSAYEAQILSDGQIVLTNIPVSNYNVLGFWCADNSCSSSSGVLWSGNSLNSGSDNIITLEYPDTLQASNGYGLIFYKEGYIPSESIVDYDGSGSSSATIYFAKKQDCFSNILSLTTNTNSVKSNEVLTTTVRVSSPISNAGLVNFIPSALSSYYSSNVIVSLNLLDSLGNILKSEQKTVGVSFSSNADVSFSWNNLNYNGAYTLRVISSCTTLCSNSLTNLNSKNIQIQDVSIPVISGISSIPTFPINNDGTRQIVSFNFNSNEYPLDLNFKIFSGNTLVYSEIKRVNSASELPVAFSIPANLATGTYSAKLYFSDLAGNFFEYSAGNIIVTNSIVDNVAPVISLSSPIDGREYSSMPTIKLSTNEVSLVSFSLNNGVNTSISSNDGVNFEYALSNLNNGTYTLRVYASDLSGNTNSVSVSFKIKLSNSNNESNKNNKHSEVIDVLSESNSINSFNDFSDEEISSTGLSILLGKSENNYFLVYWIIFCIALLCILLILLFLRK